MIQGEEDENFNLFVQIIASWKHPLVAEVVLGL
jgi:hypothetical protein